MSVVPFCNVYFVPGPGHDGSMLGKVYGTTFFEI